MKQLHKFTPAEIIMLLRGTQWELIAFAEVGSKTGEIEYCEETGLPLPTEEELHSDLERYEKEIVRRLLSDEREEMLKAIGTFDERINKLYEDAMAIKAKHKIN